MINFHYFQYIFLFLSIVFSIITHSLKGQEAISFKYPEGVYYSQEDFIHRKPDTTQSLRRINFGLHSSKAFLDTIVDHVWFLHKKNEILKKAFAVVYQGEIYFHEAGIKNSLMEGFGNRSAFRTFKLHRVQLRGRYLYSEANYPTSDPVALMIIGHAVGAVSGPIRGAAVATGASMSDAQIVEAPFIYDTKQHRFIAFHSRKILQNFMDQFEPGLQYQVEKGQLDIEIVKELFRNLNAL